MFSVIIPTYNRLELLKRAIDSVMNQTFQEFEIIVVDDCSSDDTWEWLKKNKDERIRPFRNSENKGPSINRNFAVDKSTYKYLAFLDDDDFWYENHLSSLRDIITSFPNAGLFSNSYIINYGYRKVEAIHDNKFLNDTTTEFNIFKCFSNTNSLCAPSATVIPKNIYLEVGGFDPKVSIAEDIDLQVRIGLKYPIVHSRKFTVEYDQSTGDHLSLNHINDKNAISFDKYLKEELEYPYLNQWLDRIRFQIGMKFLEVGSKKYKGYFNSITPKNLPFFKKIFISLNYNLMKSILVAKKHLNKYD